MSGTDSGDSPRLDASAADLCGGVDGGADVPSIDDGAPQTPTGPTGDTGPSIDAAGPNPGDGGADVSLIDDGAPQTPTGPTGDTGASIDAAGPNPGDGYPQWWSPECAQSAGPCSDPTCSSITLLVSPTACGTPEAITVGCIPTDMLLSIGWGCFVRLSDREIIFTLAWPPSTAGLETCTEAGLAPRLGNPGPGEVCSDQ